MRAMASPTSQRWFASTISVRVGPMASRTRPDAPRIVGRVGADLDLEMRPALGDSVATSGAHLVVGVTHPPD